MTMAYRLKKVSYKNNSCHILLQNENGPCPLIAAANALLLRGALALSAGCVRSNVISIEDLIHALAEFALQRVHAASNTGSAFDNAGTEAPFSVPPPSVSIDAGDDEAMTRQKHQERHVQEMMELLPGLQYGLDLNPKFTQGPDGCEYTVGLTTFDALGVDLVHGWLADPQHEALHDVLMSKSYNELVELVIHGKEADEEVGRLSRFVSDKERELETSLMSGWVDVEAAPPTAASARPLVNPRTPATERKEKNVSGCEPGVGDSVSNGVDDIAEDGKESPEDKDNTLPESDNTVAGSGGRIVDGGASEGASSSNGSELAESCIMVEKPAVPNRFVSTDSGVIVAKPADEPPPSGVPEAEEGKTFTVNECKGRITALTLEKELADAKARMRDAQDKATRGRLINDFLDDTGHQLTYYGLEKLHEYISEGQLCVFFRNNHFSTIVKNEGRLFLLVTDLGYANVQDVVWERLDVIDGDTDYVDCVFQKTRPQSLMQPTAPILNPEQVLSQKGQVDLDHQLAVRLQKGGGINDASLDDEEAALIAAATEASLNSFHDKPSSAEGTAASVPGTVAPLPVKPTGENVLQGQQEEPQQHERLQQTSGTVDETVHNVNSDHAMALALQAQYEDSASEALARRLQAEEDERQRAARGGWGVGGANRSPAGRRAATASGENKCTIS